MPEHTPSKRGRMRRLLTPASRAGRWSLVCSIVLALGGSTFAVGKTVSGDEARFSSQNTRYTEVTRNTRDGDGGAAAMTCESNTGNEPCLSMVNKGDGFAAAFRTRGVTGFRLQTSGSGTATPFLLDANATGKVEHLNADRLDGLDSTEVGREQWALVDGDGTPAFIRQNGATSVSRAGPGDYRVQFSRDVSACSYQATIADLSGNRTIATAADPGAANQVQVSIRRAGTTNEGERVDSDFQIAVHC
jgi:hypothetical protein